MVREDLRECKSALVLPKCWIGWVAGSCSCSHDSDVPKTNKRVRVAGIVSECPRMCMY